MFLHQSLETQVYSLPATEEICENGRARTLEDEDLFGSGSRLGEEGPKIWAFLESSIQDY